MSDRVPQQVWFKHELNTLADPHMDAFFTETGAAGYGVFWRVTEILYRDGTAEKSKLNHLLSKRVLLSPEVFDSIIDAAIKFELWFLVDDNLYSHRVQTDALKRGKVSEIRSSSGMKGGRPKSKNKQTKANESKTHREEERRVDEEVNKHLRAREGEPFTLSTEEYQALLINHCDNDQAFLDEQIQLAKDACRAEGTFKRDGQAYMRTRLFYAKQRRAERDMADFKKRQKTPPAARHDANMAVVEDILGRKL